MWVNQKDFKTLPIMDQITCHNIIRWRRRKLIKPLLRKEKNGSYSVCVADPEHTEDAKQAVQADAEIARRDWEREIYRQCDEEDAVQLD